MRQPAFERAEELRSKLMHDRLGSHLIFERFPDTESVATAVFPDENGRPRHVHYSGISMATGDSDLARRLAQARSDAADAIRRAEEAVAKVRAAAQRRAAGQRRVNEQPVALLRDALRHSEQESVARDEFVAMVAHEIRQPLHAALGSMAVLAATSDETGSRDRALGTLRRQLTHIDRLIGDLLDVTRNALDRLDLRLERVDVALMMKAVAVDVQPLMDRCHHTLETEVPAPGIAAVNGDPLRLHQVFLNLLENAAKYTPEGGLVRFACRREGHDVMIAVQDSGPGIPEADREAVFEMFTRKAVGSGAGAGIGLAVVKALVVRHGGTVAITSGPGDRGTEVRVLLPAL